MNSFKSVMYAGLLTASLLAAWPPARTYFLTVTSSIQYGFDRRPVETVLFIGNSRTLWHGMPDMVSRIATKTVSPVRYVITVKAWNGASFEENWKNDDLQRTLSLHWDHVILQAESRAHSSAENQASFFEYGGRLIAAANASKSAPALVVNWGYGEALWSQHPAGSRTEHNEALRGAHRTLARQNDAALIDVGRAWEQLLSHDKNIVLYEDGNHPTVQGSYLAALAVVRFLAKRPICSSDWKPDGVSQIDSSAIRAAVDDVVDVAQH